MTGLKDPEETMGFIMKTIVSLLLFLILLTGFTLKNKEDKPAEYLIYVSEIVNSFAKEMKKEFDINCIGDGGSMPYDVEEIEVVFSTNHRASLEEARELEIKTTEKLLHAINNHEKIRPYLREFPFTRERVCVTIGFDDAYGIHYADGTVAYTFSSKGRIYYCNSDPIEKGLVDLFDEPFEEAQRIVQENPLNRDLRVHQSKGYESQVDQIFKAFTKELEKKWGLYCMASGGKMADGIDEFAINLITPGRAPIERARKLGVEVTDRLLEIINSDERIRPYLREYPFKADRVKVSITFKKHDRTYFMDGSVAIVQQADNKLYYFTMPPPENNRYKLKPVPLSEEPYERAKGLLEKKTPTAAL